MDLFAVSCKSQAIRKYFPCSVVVEGTLEIYQDGK
jgi:hypothetical protein